MPEGRFQLVEVLGHGAFAAVLVARDKARTGSPLVAVKILGRPHLANATAVNRFRDEARILGSIAHPTIVRAHDLLDYDGQPVMVMEYVRGASLEELCLGRHKRLRLAPVAILEVSRRVALALHDAYFKALGPSGEPMRIIHRDVKPANIMLSDRGEVKLLDFGIAKGVFRERRAKSLVNVAGSAGYDAPERRSGNDTPGADVYALGVTLFVCLTGRPMLLPAGEEGHEASADELMERVESSRIDEEGLRRLVRSMVAFQPGARPTMTEVAEDLDRLLVDSSPLRDLEAGPSGRSVRGVLAARTARPLSQADDYRFLEQSVPTPPPQALNLTDATEAVRAFLKQDGWEARVPDLQRLLDAAPSFVESPFVAIIGRATVPRWKFWSTSARPSEVEAAIMVLCDHLTPRVIRSVRPLLSHPDQRIVMAARFLVERNES